jgi:hypothetical protein
MLLAPDVKAYLLYEVCDSNDNRFSISGLRPYIESCDTHDVITHSTKRIVVNYVYPRKDMQNKKIPPIRFLQSLLHRVTILSEYFGVDVPMHTVYIMPSLFPRVFPCARKNEVFEPKHINGGYTYMRDKTIFIYRCEELAKVFIHEICHHMPIHIPFFDTNATKKIATFFNIQSTLLVNEAVVEFWARLMHCKMLAKKYHIPFGMLIQKEIEHSISHTKRVLEYKDKVLGSAWNEHTNAFSYIVLTSVLLTFYKEFIRIPYPYVSSDHIAQFILDKFTSQAYQRRLRSVSVPRDTSCRMTVFGDF